MENLRKKKRSAKTDEGTTTFSIVILPSQKLALNEVAEKMGKSVSSIMRKILADQIKKWEEEGYIEKV